jgi:hypothetical protein
VPAKGNVENIPLPTFKISHHGLITACPVLGTPMSLNKARSGGNMVVRGIVI